MKPSYIIFFPKIDKKVTAKKIVMFLLIYNRFEVYCKQFLKCHSRKLDSQQTYCQANRNENMKYCLDSFFYKTREREWAADSKTQLRRSPYRIHTKM